jgi:hypothetical protein
MRRTTGGTLLAPFSSSGSLLAPGFASSAGDVPATAIAASATSAGQRAPAVDPLQAEAAVARVTREAVIDARDPSLVAAQANAHAVRGVERRALEERETTPRPARDLAPTAPPSDRPPPPVMPAIGRRRAQRRNAERAS